MRIEKDNLYIDISETDAWKMLYSAIGAHINGKEFFVLVDPALKEVEFPTMNFIQAMMRMLSDEECSGCFSVDGCEIVH